jgi:hypothetical protein
MRSVAHQLLFTWSRMFAGAVDSCESDPSSRSESDPSPGSDPVLTAVSDILPCSYNWKVLGPTLSNRVHQRNRQSLWMDCSFSSMHSIGSGNGHVVVGSGRAYVKTAVVLESCSCYCGKTTAPCHPQPCTDVSAACALPVA